MGCGRASTRKTPHVTAIVRALSTAEALRSWATSRQLYVVEEVRRLRLEGVPDEALLRSVLSSPRLGQVRELDLRGCLLGPEAIAAPAASLHVPSLTSLWLDDNPLGPEGARRLATTRSLPGQAPRAPSAT